MADNVKHPSHYCKNGMECIDAIKAVVGTITDPFEAYCTGNIIKYIWRWNDKNGIEDLHKAMQYIDFIERYRTSKQSEIGIPITDKQSEDPLEMGEEDVSEPTEQKPSTTIIDGKSYAVGKAWKPSEPVKGKYEGLSDEELRRDVCSAIKHDCAYCPISRRWNGKKFDCTEFVMFHPEEFRKIAIDWLNKQEGLEGKA